MNSEKTSENIFMCNSFLVAKKDGANRRAVNLKYLNQFIGQKYFKMVSFSSANYYRKEITCGSKILKMLFFSSIALIIKWLCSAMFGFHCQRIFMSSSVYALA